MYLWTNKQKPLPTRSGNASTYQWLYYHNLEAVTIRTWSVEDVERELSEYRRLTHDLTAIKLDIEALEDELDDAIHAASIPIGVGDGMPRGNTTSDPTARIAASTPDTAELASLRHQIRPIERRIRRMNAWLCALTPRERKVVKLFCIDDMTWAEVVVAYNVSPLDAQTRQQRTLRDWKVHAIRYLARIAR